MEDFLYIADIACNNFPPIAILRAISGKLILIFLSINFIFGHKGKQEEIPAGQTYQADGSGK